MYQEKTLKARLTGICPLLISNSHMADPTFEIARELAKIKSKHHKKKTDADHTEIQRLGFLGALYINGNGVYIPGNNIVQMLINAGRKMRKTDEVKAGVTTGVGKEHFPLIYKGPKTSEKLWENKNFHLHCLIPALGKGRVSFTYPMFTQWALDVEIVYFADTINLQTVKDLFELAGRAGLGCWRPRYGRFEVEYQNGVQNEN